MFPHIPTPAGALHVFGWHERNGAWWREFEGTKRPLGVFDVTIAGRQYADGAEQRYACIYSTDHQKFGADDLRSIAALVTTIADEIEGTSGDAVGESRGRGAGTQHRGVGARAVR